MLSETHTVIRAHALRKRYGTVHALDGLDLTVARGRIVGLIGPNGSGKTTALRALLGLTRLDDGELSVLGCDPFRARATLMRRVAYIADTGILPRWMRVQDLLDHIAAVHPHFSLQDAVHRLQATDILPGKKIGVLSKGMHVQLHLAIVQAMAADLLVLDEPTLGLDLIYRQRFYETLLNDYFTGQRSILVTTHEVREIEHILTDVVFMHRGRAVLTAAMEEIPQTYRKLVCPESTQLPFTPIHQQMSLTGLQCIFRDVPAEPLAALGEVSTPNLAELFIAVVGDTAHTAEDRVA